MTRSMLPAFARVLLRILPLGDRRREIEADLAELFALRAATKGNRYAGRRCYGDVLSLWRSLDMRTAVQSRPPARLPILRHVAQDLTYAGRLLRRSPASVAVTIGGLGLAIGVCTSVFTLFNAVLFRSGGIVDPASAVRVLRSYKNGLGSSWRYSEYVQLRDASRTLRLEAWHHQARIPLELADSRALVGTTFVTGGYLSALSDRAALGRLLTPADDVPGAAPVAVASYGYWSANLGADPQIVGRTQRLNGVAVTIVGVAPRGFVGATDSPPALWMPIASYHQLMGGAPVDNASAISVPVVARLKPGVTRRQAEEQLGALAMATSSPMDAGSEPVAGVRLTDPFGPTTAAEMWRIAAIVAVIATVIGSILLLACVNVANLLLASGIARQREIAVRLALGASRGRLVSQLLTESASLGIAGGVLGLAVCWWLAPTLAVVTQAPPYIDFTPDGRVFVFLATVSALAGVGAGLVPARHAVQNSLVVPLRGVEGLESAPRRSGLRNGLIGVQAAASLVLLVLAALLTRGAVRATTIDLGFDPERLLVVSATFPRGAYDGAGSKSYWTLATERVSALPGVQSVSLASFPPFGGANRVTILRREQYTIFHHDVGAHYFPTLGLRIVRGRTFTADELEDRASVAVISDALAKQYFGEEDPVGKPLDRIMPGSTDTIVGVAANAITARLRDRSAAATYTPLTSAAGAQMLVRTDGAPGSQARSIRTAIEAVDPRVRLSIRTVADGVDRQLSEARVVASLVSVLAALALGLAVVGIYGVTAFVVGRRTPEMGVRMALGATGRDVTRLLLGDSLRPVALGLTAGIFVAILASRVFSQRPFSGLLFGVNALDPVAFAGAVAILVAAAVVAVIVPARRASRVDPAAVLRQL